MVRNQVRSTMKRLLSIAAAGAFALSASQAMAGQDNDMFILHDLAQSPEEAATAVREFAEAHDDWLFLAEFCLAGGAVTELKVCYLPLGPDIVAAGWHVMAMMPCGHLAFYEEDGQTRLSQLDLKFMTTLNPDENLERAVETGNPAFAAMLDEVLGVGSDDAS
jgi:hypothetical protein